MRTKDLTNLTNLYIEIARGQSENVVEEEKSPPSTLESTYRKMWEDAAVANKKKTAGATDKEDILDKESGKSKDFVKLHGMNVDDTEEKGHEDVAKAGRAVTKQSPSRRGTDNLDNGDKKTQNLTPNKVPDKGVTFSMRTKK